MSVLDLGVVFVSEGEGPGGAGIRAAGLGPAPIEEMGAEGALLGDVEVVVEVDDVLIGAGFQTELVAPALLRVDDDDAVRLVGRWRPAGQASMQGASSQCWQMVWW